MTPTASQADVVVIDGGPAGSTTATLLAQHGRRVVLFERERHPRFHKDSIDDLWGPMDELRAEMKQQQANLTRV